MNIQTRSFLYFLSLGKFFSPFVGHPKSSRVCGQELCRPANPTTVCCALHAALEPIAFWTQIRRLPTELRGCFNTWKRASPIPALQSTDKSGPEMCNREDFIFNQQHLLCLLPPGNPDSKMREREMFEFHNHSLSARKLALGILRFKAKAFLKNRACLLLPQQNITFVRKREVQRFKPSLLGVGVECTAVSNYQSLQHNPSEPKLRWS